MFDEFKENFKESASRFFVLENLVLAGMLCALGIVITTVTGMLPILPRYMKLGLGSGKALHRLSAGSGCKYRNSICYGYSRIYDESVIRNIFYRIYN